MNKLSIYQQLLTEIKKDAIISAIGEVNTTKLFAFTQDDAYYHFVVNTLKNEEGHSIDDLLDRNIYQKFRTYVSSAWNSNRSVEVETAGSKVELVKDRSGYDDFIKYLSVKESLAAKTGDLTSLISEYWEVGNQHFRALLNDSEWYIAYPETIAGSMALGRSYWDSEKEYIAYDTTFNNGVGEATGKISWCTVISGPFNQFTSYHMNKKLHMFYCVSKRFGKEDNRRKLCLSLEKKSGKVYFSDDMHSCVDGENRPQGEEFFRKCLGSRYDDLVKYTEDNLEEIDYEKYYTEYNLMQYRVHFENPNIPFSYNVLINVLDYTKDFDRILAAILKSEVNTNDKFKVLIQCRRTPPDTLTWLAHNCDNDIKELVAGNHSTPHDTLTWLAHNCDNDIKELVADNHSTPPDTLTWLAHNCDDDDECIVKYCIAGNHNTPPDTLDWLAEHGHGDVKMQIAYNPSTPEHIRQKLKQEIGIHESYSSLKKYIKLLIK